MGLPFSPGPEVTKVISGESKLQEECEKQTSMSSKTCRHLLLNETKAEVGFLCTFKTQGVDSSQAGT